MGSRQEIVVWDISPERIQAMEIHIKRALHALGVQASVQFNSEEPLLSRHHLLGKTPAVQVNGGVPWRCTPAKTISTEEFVHLFTQLKERGLMEF